MSRLWRLWDQLILCASPSKPAAILSLFPLTSRGGSLWRPLCYAQIGGSGAYGIAVLDLKIVKLERQLKGDL